MAGGFWRGQAAERNIFMSDLARYLGGLGGGQLQSILQSLYKTSEPILSDIMGDYAHQSAGLGQVVPGQGFSGAAQKGEWDLVSRYVANLLGQGLQAYQMPWQSRFGSLGGVAQQYQAGQQQPGFEGFAGQLLGMGLGALGSGFGSGLGMKWSGWGG